MLAAVGAFAAMTLTAGCSLAYREGVSDRPRSAGTARDSVNEAAPDPGAETPPRVVHIVERGQTLFRIAAAYGVELDALMRANGIDDPTTLEVGTELTVPGATRVVAVPPSFAPAPPASPGVDPRSESTATYAWPLTGEILSRFGDRRGSRRHRGVDIRGERGAAVLASRAGTVVLSAETGGGYGRTVVLDHGDGYRSLYAHNDELLVRAGQAVEAGTPVARVGKTGNATTEHLHFEIRKGNDPVDPLPFLEGVLEARR